jgi:hypothetical protein
MCALFAACLFAIILVSAILCIAGVFGAILILAYRDPNACFSYFAGRIATPRVTDF